MRRCRAAVPSVSAVPYVFAFASRPIRAAPLPAGRVSFNHKSCAQDLQRGFSIGTGRSAGFLMSSAAASRGVMTTTEGFEVFPLRFDDRGQLTTPRELEALLDGAKAGGA